MTRTKVTVARSVWHIECPKCGVEIDTTRTDAGQHDDIEVSVDCPGCETVIHTVTVVVVVAALTAVAASKAAAKIRGKATDCAAVVMAASKP